MRKVGACAGRCFQDKDLPGWYGCVDVRPRDPRRELEQYGEQPAFLDPEQQHAHEREQQHRFSCGQHLDLSGPDWGGHRVRFTAPVQGTPCRPVRRHSPTDESSPASRR